jgi:hypothetical protein
MIGMGSRRGTLVLIFLLIAGLAVYAAEKRVLARREHALRQLRTVSVASAGEPRRPSAMADSSGEAAGTVAEGGAALEPPGAGSGREQAAGIAGSPSQGGRTQDGAVDSSVYIGWASGAEPGERPERRERGRSGATSPRGEATPSGEEFSLFTPEAPGPSGDVLDASSGREEGRENRPSPPDTQSNWFFGEAESVRAGPIWEEGVGGRGGDRSMLALSPPSQSLSLGKPVAINVEIRGIEEFYHASFEVEYDPSLLEVASVREGDFANRDWRPTTFSSDIDNSRGRVTVTISRESPESGGVSGSGVLARIRFTTLSTGECRIGLENAVVMTTDMKFAPVDIGAAIVNVVGP